MGKEKRETDMRDGEPDRIDLRRPVVFVDIDGVLVTRDTTLKYGIEALDPKLCSRLRGVLKHFPDGKPQLVISSAWRMGRSVGDLRALFAPHGLRVADKTPELRDDGRGREILLYLKSTGVNPDDRFEWPTVAILDDEIYDIAGVGRIRPTDIVHTAFLDGLTGSDCERLAGILSKSSVLPGRQCPCQHCRGTVERER